MSQRIDACRDERGNLLLVELEDLNPYLSVLELSSELKDKFIESFNKSISRVLNSN